MRVEFVGVHEIKKYQDQKHVTFIDLRDAKEYQKRHIRGAISMPYELFLTRYMTLPRNGVYILYCERGATSILAAAAMLNAGYRVRSLAGGINAAMKSIN